MRSLIVGMVARTSRSTEVAAPVRLVLKIEEDSAVTVTSSVAATVLRVSARSVATPRLTITSLVTWGRKLVSETVTV